MKKKDYKHNKYTGRSFSSLDGKKNYKILCCIHHAEDKDNNFNTEKDEFSVEETGTETKETKKFYIGCDKFLESVKELYENNIPPKLDKNALYKRGGVL